MRKRTNIWKMLNGAVGNCKVKYAFFVFMDDVDGKIAGTRNWDRLMK